LTASTLLAAGVAASTDDPVGDLAMPTLLVGVILLGSDADRALRSARLSRRIGAGLRGTTLAVTLQRQQTTAPAAPSPSSMI
jgi:hypothetical protein